MRSFLTGVLLLALVAVSPVRADRKQDVGLCKNALWSPQVGIAACTRLLRTWQTTSANRAIFYFNRGNAYRRLKQYHQAIADYDQAIRLNPRDADAYFNRGLTYQYFYKNRRQAIADYRAAYKLQPWTSKYAAQLRELGVEP